MHLETYLTFNGNCREAFEFYREVFGGEFNLLSTFAEGPPDMGVPEADMDLILHLSLPIGSSVLMGSDTTSAFGPPPEVGGNFSLSVTADSMKQCDELFASLSEGGAVIMPMAKTFWGSYFGRFTDKFGINWMISFEMSAHQA